MSLDEGREIARLYGDAGMPTSEIRARFGIGESSLYRIIQQQGIPLRGHISAATAAAAQPAPAVKKTGRKRASSDGRQTAAPLAAAAATSTRASSGGTKFRIRYLGERVFEAQSIQDALRQAEALGATEITAVTRED